MAKPNYQFEKRQRELGKKKKKEEKLQQRRSGVGEPGEPGTEQDGTEATEPGAESGNDTGAAPQSEASA
ncbi:MAG: hypothetical protein V4532_05175 [Pseudomonadota bacterium]